MVINLSISEISLLVQALEMAASRHEAYARFRPEAAGPHDRKAQAMRALRDRLRPPTKPCLSLPPVYPKSNLRVD